VGGSDVNITADTNLLVRAAVRDDAAQADQAARALRTADAVAVTLPTLCEFTWVLRRLYHVDPAGCANAIRALSETENVLIDRPASEAGLAVLACGGDFADGVIAFEGRRLGGEVFVSFDVDAVKRLDALGHAAHLVGEARAPGGSGAAGVSG